MFGVHNGEKKELRESKPKAKEAHHNPDEKNTSEMADAIQKLMGPGGEYELGQLTRADHPEWGSLLVSVHQILFVCPEIHN